MNMLNKAINFLIILVPPLRIKYKLKYKINYKNKIWPCNFKAYYKRALSINYTTSKSE